MRFLPSSHHKLNHPPFSFPASLVHSDPFIWFQVNIPPVHPTHPVFLFVIPSLGVFYFYYYYKLPDLGTWERGYLICWVMGHVLLPNQNCENNPFFQKLFKLVGGDSTWAWTPALKLLCGSGGLQWYSRQKEMCMGLGISLQYIYILLLPACDSLMLFKSC